MMGERRVMQEALFYGFSLERRVPDNHILRRIDRFVDLSEVRAHLGPYYSDVGRPSIDPELLIRMLLVGYCFGNVPSGGRARRFTSIWIFALCSRAETRRRALKPPRLSSASASSPDRPWP